jgi:outer membrane protein OmpA-like peptidoglycan-associated protein
MTNTTKGFATKFVQAAGTAVLASMLAIASVAQGAQTMSVHEATQTRVLFFDVNSASLGADARTIVLSAVDAAERSGAKLIEIAAYASDEESARDGDLASRRAEVVKQQVVDYGFQGTVLVDEEGPEFRLVGLSDTTIDRRVVLRLGS